MKTHTRTILGALGAIAVLSAGIPEARAQEARGAAPRAPEPSTSRFVRKAPAPAVRGEGEAARRLHSWLEQELRAAAKRRFLGISYGLRYGLEPEPPAQAELKREIFLFLSELTGESSLRRTAASIQSSSTVRAVVDSEADDRARRQGTFVEIEELQGTSPRPISPTAQGAFASTGALLFASGILGTKVVSAASLVVAPQPWPAGLRISGTFELP